MVELSITSVYLQSDYLCKQEKWRCHSEAPGLNAASYVRSIDFALF